MNVSSSSYYESEKRFQKCESNQILERSIITAFWRHKRRYGTRRLVEELKDEGIKVGRARIRSTLSKNQLRAIQPRSFVPRTTQSDPMLRRSPNLLIDRSEVRKPNEVRVGDITYLPRTDGNWLYLAIWLDVWSHYIVGWCVEEHMEEALIKEAFNRALKIRNPGRGLIVHSDGGGQYGAKGFREQLSREGFKQSMTRKDNHYDNAIAESLFSRFKSELLDGGKFISLEDARIECFEYIDGYYNTIRKHSSIGYKSPLQFEREMGY